MKFFSTITPMRTIMRALLVHIGSEDQSHVNTEHCAAILEYHTKRKSNLPQHSQSLSLHILLNHRLKLPPPLLNPNLHPKRPRLQTPHRRRLDPSQILPFLTLS